MDINFHKANDELDVDDYTRRSTTRGGQYIIAKWDKKRNKFLKVEVVIKKGEFKVINVKVTSNEANLLLVNDLKEQCNKVKRF